MVDTLSAEDFVNAIAAKELLDRASHLLVQFDSINEHNHRVESASMRVHRIQQLIRLRTALSILGQPWKGAAFTFTY